MPRESRESLAERARLLEKQNHLLSAGFQAAANGEIKWYARTRFDNTSFRFGVFGLTRADGGHLVVQTRVKQNDGKVRPALLDSHSHRRNSKPRDQRRNFWHRVLPLSDPAAQRSGCQQTNCQGVLTTFSNSERGGLRWKTKMAWKWFSATATGKR